MPHHQEEAKDYTLVVYDCIVYDTVAVFILFLLWKSESEGAHGPLHRIMSQTDMDSQIGQTQTDRPIPNFFNHTEAILKG